MPPYALQLLIALLLVGLTPALSYPLAVGSGRVDALDAALLGLALVNLRVAWSAANAAGAARVPGGRGGAPAWFVLGGLVTAGLITWAMIRALTPTLPS
ncbi:hypothetical protein [Deinococcus depolymerans]|uniref:Uncharacterized protein n=1 Tax=Deinococcus depolymerans TaxID=392408 RepID=A0ABN1BQ30_9DEIO